MREWETPAPIRCRLLGDTQFLITDGVVAELIALGISNTAASGLRKLVGFQLDSEAALHNAIATLASSAELSADPARTGLLRLALIQECGKSALLTSFVPPASTLPKSIRVAVGGAEVSSERIAAGSLQPWTTTAPDKDLVIDPARGRMLSPN